MISRPREIASVPRYGTWPQLSPASLRIKNWQKRYLRSDIKWPQAQRTGSPLWRAKDEALANVVVLSQFPNSGQVPPFPNIGPPWSHGVIGYNGRGSGDGGGRGEYATMALKELARLWETR